MLLLLHPHRQKDFQHCMFTKQAIANAKKNDTTAVIYNSISNSELSSIDDADGVRDLLLPYKAKVLLKSENLGSHNENSDCNDNIPQKLKMKSLLFANQMLRELIFKVL